MSPLVLALACLAAGGALGFLLCALGRERLGLGAAAAGGAAGSAVGLVLALRAIGGARVAPFRAPWALPGAEVRLAVDPLSAWFLLPIFVVGGLASVYGAGYLAHHRGKKALGPPLLFFNLLLAAMTLVVTARHAFLFIFAWELMTLLAFLLVSFEDEKEEVRRAAFLYVTISHVAALFVLAFFLVLGRDAGSLDLEAMAAGAASRTGLRAGVLFLFALVGFGTKAGIAPLHVWLPRAHPVAPSHVSAVMSAVIVKTALYAFLRALTLLGPTPAWCGFLLLGLGVVSGVGGILFGYVQSDLKRLLAYSTIENVGIMLVGIGTGIVGGAYGNRTVAVLGYTGALLHVVSHAVMKGLLFASAGAVLHAAHTRAIDRLGGLWKRMPTTGAAFLAGALAIAAVPGFCGFASEWVVYAGLLRAGFDLEGAARAAAIAAIPALAGAGGLAAAALAKGFGLVFLGEPRSEESAHAEEVPLSMRGPLAILAALALALGLAPVLLARGAVPIAATLARVSAEEARALAAPVLAPLGSIVWAALLLFAIAGALALVRRALLAGRKVEAARTWGCGYGAPSARRQYTAASFALPLAHAARGLLRPRVLDRPPEGYFPGLSVRRSTFDDPAEDRLFAAGARRVEAWLLALRWLQQGRLSLYLLYMFVAVLGLLAWQILASGGKNP